MKNIKEFIKMIFNDTFNRTISAWGNIGNPPSNTIESTMTTQIKTLALDALLGEHLWLNGSEPMEEAALENKR